MKKYPLCEVSALLIEEYFQILQSLIAACPSVELSNITFDKRGNHEGFIKGEMLFCDGSTLHIREFTDTEQGIEKLMYAYHYTSSSKELLFRYDNTGHFKKLCASTYPHHKHIGPGDSVLPSAEPDLAIVLMEIGAQVHLL